ncbi:hypothetical protein NKJ17_29590 [Mesorhizobium sp. M0208]
MSVVDHKPRMRKPRQQIFIEVGSIRKVDLVKSKQWMLCRILMDALGVQIKGVYFTGVITQHRHIISKPQSAATLI